MSDMRPKALVLFSGGLDSMLAIRLILGQGVKVEAVHFLTPFCSGDLDLIERFCEENGVKLHKVSLGLEFVELVTSPPHGHGSHMNPCIDCRILELKKAKELGERIGADFLATGEVLDERPFSQRRDLMLLIEREAGLSGRILRPLSAKLLPETEPERTRLVAREILLDIRGRKRHLQMKLAKEMGIKEYQSPAGGCLLTDPRFSERLKEHLQHEKGLSLRDIELLKVGRHFRADEAKIIVGRNQEENEELMAIAERQGLAHLEVMGHMGPVTVLCGRISPGTVRKAAAITVRYSDAPRDGASEVRYSTREREKVLQTIAIGDEELKSLLV